MGGGVGAHCGNSHISLSQLKITVELAQTVHIPKCLTQPHSFVLSLGGEKRNCCRYRRRTRKKRVGQSGCVSLSRAVWTNHLTANLPVVCVPVRPVGVHFLSRRASLSGGVRNQGCGEQQVGALAFPTYPEGPSRKRDKNHNLLFMGFFLCVCVCAWLCLCSAQPSESAVKMAWCLAWRSWFCPNSTRKAPTNASSTLTNMSAW